MDPIIQSKINKLKKQNSDIAKRQKIYKDQNKLRSILIEGFKASSGYTGSNCTYVQDTADFKTGTSCLKITQTATGYTAIDIPCTLDLSKATNFELWVKIPDETKTNQIGLYFFNAGGGNFYKFRNNLRNGWIKLRFNKASFTQSGTIAWTDTITKITLNLGSQSGQTAIYYIDSLWQDCVEPANVIFVADDGFTSAYTQFIPYIESKGMKGNVAIVSDWVGTANYMTLAQIQDIYNRGHDVLNHSKDHADFSTKTYLQTANSIQSGREWLYANGFTRGLDGFMYPIAYTDMAKQVIKDLGFAYGRDSGGQWANLGIGDDPYRLRAVGLNASSVFDTSFKSAFDDVLVNGGTLFTYFHDMVASPTGVQVAISLVQQSIDYAKTAIDAGQCTNLTFSQWENSRL